MSRPRRRSVIPNTFANLEAWPGPNIHGLSEEQQRQYLQKKEAVEGYAAGHSFDDIRAATSKSEQEVRRLVRRCTTPDGRGGIYGFCALIHGKRLSGYVRTAPIKPQLGGGRGGYSGSLRKLFDSIPGVEKLIVDLILKRKISGTVTEARISYLDVHKKFLKELRQLGFSDDCWPFCTANHGYATLTKYCHDLLNNYQGEWIRARSGDEAARRASIGRGIFPIFSPMRAHSYMQLDFHKVDAASIIVIKTANFDEIEIPLARWHIGLLADEKTWIINGIYVALELTPSGDSTLEVIESALRPETYQEGDPRCLLVADGKILPNQLMPELAYQGFSVLKVDNAWANSATEVVNNIIDTVGCAVNFGPVRSTKPAGTSSM